MKEEFHMRTLKKALSLVLVLAMVFALAVPGFAAEKKASDFTDYSKVTNKEAVDVLTAIGVLNGNTAACLQAGSVLGTAAMLDGLIARFRLELGEELTVISTGTLSSAVRESCATPIRHEPNLILDGLYAIWKRNSRG